MTNSDDPGQAIEVRIKGDLQREGMNLIATCNIKDGPQVWKHASLMHMGKRPEESTKRELRVTSWRKPPGGVEPTKNAWSCEGDEIERLRAFLNENYEQASGDYSLVPAASLAARLANELEEGSVESTAALAVLRALSGRGDLAPLLTQLEDTDVVVASLELKRQQRVLEGLRGATSEPSTTEQQLQDLLWDEWWIFGGRYIERIDLRQVVLQDQLDLPLLRSDGYMHVVELKRAEIPRLVTKVRNHWAAGPDVHEAVAQAANYLRSLDESRADILARFGYDARRAFATVVIGLSKHNSATTSVEEINEALRTYNSHLSRIEVITYQDLIDTAERSISALLARPSPPDDGEMDVSDVPF